MTWHHKYIDDPTEAFNESGEYIARMDILYLVPGTKDAAIYSRLDKQSGGMHYYFTPGAGAIAMTFKATPCEKPLQADVGALLIGDHNLLEHLYP